MTEPTLGIMKTVETENSTMYRVSCACYDPDHDVNFEIENEDGSINVHFWSELRTNYWDNGPTKFQFLNKIILKSKLTFGIWFKGYLRHDAWTILNQEQAGQLAKILKRASTQR